MKETGGTILIVDDEESIRDILYRKLKAEGYYCDVAADGREALRKVSTKDFDLVLTGYQDARAVRNGSIVPAYY